jgi:hypothetical protein
MQLFQTFDPSLVPAEFRGNFGVDSFGARQKLRELKRKQLNCGTSRRCLISLLPEFLRFQLYYLLFLACLF